jgi:hypothetical protein
LFISRWQIGFLTSCSLPQNWCAEVTPEASFNSSCARSGKISRGKSGPGGLLQLALENLKSKLLLFP